MKDLFCEDCGQALFEMSLDKRKECKENHKLVTQIRILTSIDNNYQWVIKVPFSTMKERKAISKALEPLGFKLVQKTW